MIQLSKTEFATFDRFTDWVNNNDWLHVGEFPYVISFVYAEVVPSHYLPQASRTVNRILENLKLREDTRDVLVKIQYAIDLELTKLGGGL